MLKRILLFIAIAACSLWMPAQTVTLSASGTMDGGVLATGIFYFCPVLSTGGPTYYHLASGGLASVTCTQADVVSGVFSAVLPDTALTTPRNLCVRATLVTAGGNVALIPCLQPSANNAFCSAGRCNLDNWMPSIPTQPTASPYIASVNGVTGPITINCTNVGNAFTCAGSGSGGSGGAFSIDGSAISSASAGQFSVNGVVI